MAETEQASGTRIQRTTVGGIEPSAGGPAEKVLAGLSAVWDRVMAMSPQKRTWLIAVSVFLASMCAAMIWFAERPDWRVLFSGLDGKDAQQVAQQLAAAGIPYETTADGTGVKVTSDMLDKARMEVAAKGMPQTGRLGFELFDKPNWVGSEFDERVNYQRALEGELEHTIGTLAVVRSARVHLVLPQPSLFVQEEKLAKATVVLQLKRASLDTEQADAIRSLVAGSVENLNTDQVTLVDADGRINFKPRSNDGAEAEEEQLMEAKLIAMLEPLAGRDNVRASVSVSYDHSRLERTDEIYDPSQVATLTMQKSEQVSSGRGQPSGVPGTASNSPGGAPVGAVAGSQAAAAPGTPPLLQKEALPVYPQQGSGVGQSLNEENSTFGVTKHLVHMEEGPGRIRRVSAAVLVNDRSITEGTGKLEHSVWRPRSSEEMHRLEQLAQAAVGYDPQRGDQVVMENVSFSTNAPAPSPRPVEKIMEEAGALLRTQPELMRTLVIALCGVLLVFLVLRPVAKQVTATLREPAMLPANIATTAGLSVSDVQKFELDAAAEEGIPPIQNRSRSLRQQGIFDSVAEHIRREPGQSTRVIEAWIGTSGEGL